MMRSGWRRHLWPLGLIGLWGLVPLGWFLPEQFIHTQDLELPIGMSRWLAIATTWKSQFGTGAEWSISLPTLVPYLVPAITNWFTGSLVWTQRAEFVWWFLLPGVSMYTLMVAMHSSRIAALVAAHLYMFNLALASQWPGGQSALIAYALLPWVILLIIRGLRTARSWWMYAMTLGLLAGVGAGIGVNFAQAYVFMLGLLLLVGCYLFAHRGTPEGSVIRCLAFFGLAVLVGLGCNSFWMFPQAVAAKIRIADPAIAQIKDWSGSWLEGISTNASLRNVLRQQGDWTWYQGWKEPYVTYAARYQTSWILQALSWLPLGLALTGLLTRRGWVVGYCGLTMVVGLIWSTGVHPPFRPLYLWCVHHVPLFWIIRSPWFKFMGLTSLGYAALGGLAVETLRRRVQRWLPARWGAWRVSTTAAAIVAGTVLVAHSVYARPLILGQMFPKPHERREVTPAHTAIPGHVYQAAAWINRNAPAGRFACLPFRVNGASIYDWRFSAPVPALYYFTQAAFLFSSPSWFAVDYGNRVVEEFYLGLYRHATPSAVSILRLLGADYVLQEDDVTHDYFEARDDDPAFIRARLAEQEGLSPAATIGPRQFYAVEAPRPLVYVADRVVGVVGTHPGGVPMVVKGHSEVMEDPGVHLGLVPLTLTSHLDGRGALIAPAELEGLARDTVPWHAVVLYNAPPLDAASRRAVASPAVGLTIFITPETFAEQLTEGRHPSTICAVTGWTGLAAPEPGGEGGPWRWQTSSTTGHPCFEIENATGRPLVTNVQIPLTTIHANRDVEVFVNDIRILSSTVRPNQSDLLRLHAMTLTPGRNTVCFATPMASVPRGAERVTYAVGEDVRLGTFTLVAPVSLPRGGTYTVRVHPTPLPEAVPDALAVSWDGVGIALRYGTPREGFVGGTVEAAAGTHEVRLRNPAPGVCYLVELSQAGAPPVPSRPGHATFTRRSSTDVSATVTAPGPCVLVLNESYHPAWAACLVEADGRLRRLPHTVVNGFANGYYLDRPGTCQVQFRFTLQDLFEQGVRISMATTAAAGFVLAVAMLVMRRRR